jgi:RNA polymerase sigma factor (TIGR02999 family)
VGDQHFETRRHFFAAAAAAMRRILVENARRKRRQKHGGHLVRRPLDQVDVAAADSSYGLLALHDALQKLTAADATAAQLVELRFFAGMTIPQVAELMNLSPRTADRLWAYARAFLHSEIYSGN